MSSYLRDKVIAKYGGKCQGCGSTNSLEIHHVNRDGKEERLKYSPGDVLAMALDDTDGRYQLLCKSCHKIVEFAPHYKNQRDLIAYYLLDMIGLSYDRVGKILGMSRTATIYEFPRKNRAEKGQTK